jgi:hypothetical protein
MSPKTTKGPGKRHPLNMRTTKELRQRLDSAAKKSGRSLVQEVEARLDRSFYLDGILKTHMGEAGELVNALSLAVSYALLRSKLDKQDQYRALQVAAGYIIAAFGAVMPPKFGYKGFLSIFKTTDVFELEGMWIAQQVLKGLGFSELAALLDTDDEVSALIRKMQNEQSPRDDLSEFAQRSISEQILDGVRRSFSPETRALVESIRQIHDAERAGEITRKLEAGDIDGAIEAVGHNPQSFQPYDKKIIEALKAAATAAGGIVQTPEETQKP